MGLIPLPLSGIWSAIKSISWQTWVAIVLAITILLSVIYVYSLKSNITDLNNTNSQLTSQVTSLSEDLGKANKNNTELKAEAKLNIAKLNAYQAILGDSDAALEFARNKLDNDAKRESTVAKKPGLVTIKTKKSYDSLEREFQCVSGQLESCYPVSSSSDAKAQPKKKQTK